MIPPSLSAPSFYSTQKLEESRFHVLYSEKKRESQSSLAESSVELARACTVDSEVPLSTLFLENDLACHICILPCLSALSSPAGPGHGSIPSPTISMKEPWYSAPLEDQIPTCPLLVLQSTALPDPPKHPGPPHAHHSQQLQPPSHT